MERRLLNPKIDFVFKKIFGSEKHPGVLISFLNAVLKPKNNITDVEIKNTDIDKSYIEDKFSRLDVKAVTSKNEIIKKHYVKKNKNKGTADNPINYKIGMPVIEKLYYKYKGKRYMAIKSGIPTSVSKVFFVEF